MVNKNVAGWNIPIKQKLLFSFILVVIICLALSTLQSATLITRTMKNTVSEAQEKSFKTIKNLYLNKLNYLENLSKNIAAQPDIQQATKKKSLILWLSVKCCER
ncbi:hypothetical protein BBF96_11925 [Anoxybacter fermentans]|uniref:Uncharacterized protein n=1 Tax=Anoxybacter fermentans TaxID=1323375 RepID=A0A3Q9HRM5_9FIRM|nr:hypothetical protein [Anoxybacter fermentans]AZR74039.1 hypothetical protein BBF96_11925 [Anoxybacter fermentans]